MANYAKIYLIMPKHASPRHQEILSYLRSRMSRSPLPELKEELLDQGASEEEISAAIEELFPGRKDPRGGRALKAGFIGAAVGALLWVIGALLYKAH